MAKRRHLSRIAVMQTLFELGIRKHEADSGLQRNIDALGGDDAVDSAFSSILLTGTQVHWNDIIASLEKHAPEWPLERMDPISRAILMMSGFEILYNNDAPPAVVMNEAIDIAKEYGTAESGKFVNGVLNALAHAGKK